jgi:hypothetical protein
MKTLSDDNFDFLYTVLDETVNSTDMSDSFVLDLFNRQEAALTLLNEIRASES